MGMDDDDTAGQRGFTYALPYELLSGFTRDFICMSASWSITLAAWTKHEAIQSKRNRYGVAWRRRR
jgi:hypothetical protein